MKFRNVLLLTGVTLGVLLTGFVSASVCLAQTPQETSETRINLVFSGGHETNPLDRGRPVVLVAGALGVAPQVFRDAFSAVHPAPDGTGPDPHQVQDNKRALLTALGPYGITNERLDQVSDYYRYRPSSGRLWRNEPASAYAIERPDGSVEVKITNPGAGYTTPPRITITGRPDLEATVTLSFGRDLSKNGSIQSITIKKRPTPIE